MRLQPSCEAELAALVAEAAAARRRLRVEGGGTRTAPGGPRDARSVILSLAGLAGVRLHDPGALTLIAAAGTPLAEVEARLAAEGQMLAFEPMDHRAILGTEGTPTIGGAVATNASGPRRVSAGACRDHLLGIRFVDGCGRVLASGGRVMKNVTGLDLGKLHCGAAGRYGILTEVALKVLPAPDSAATLVWAGTEPETAVALFTAALASPYEISGAAWAGGRACLRLEGRPAQVAGRTDRLAAQLRPLAGAPDIVTGPGHAALWQGFRDLPHLAGSAPLWRIGTRPTDAPVLVRALWAAGAAQVSLDWGGALIWVTGDIAPQALATALGTRGAAVQVRGPAPGTALPAPAPALAALYDGLGARFDPARILAPA
jgi:glycolate oxidase FAD binding subunit